MDELVKKVSSKLGISEAQAKQAADIALEYLGDKLPEPYGSQLDRVVDGDMSGLGDSAGGLTGMFGKKK
jgi:hypothetical protein